MEQQDLRKDLAACASAETLLAAILKHAPGLQAPIDVEAIARGCGITAFRTLDDAGYVSGLLHDAAAGESAILTAPGLSDLRKRFATAHQLGHFLLRRPPHDGRCTARDLAESRRDTPERKEEMQANRFAAGLLMPKPLFAPFVASLGKPVVTHLPTIATAYGVTLEAAATRYADLTQAMCALVFAKDGVVRGARPSRSFPALAIRAGDAVPAAVASALPKDRIAWAPADVRDWLILSREVRPPKLTLQTLTRENGFQLVMLFVNAAAERRADEEAEKDATERPKFGRPTRE